jgi:hypothetical protein
MAVTRSYYHHGRLQGILLERSVREFACKLTSKTTLPIALKYSEWNNIYLRILYIYGRNHF